MSSLFDPDLARTAFPVLLRGLLVTVELTVICGVLSLAFGLLVALARMSPFGPLRWIVSGYVQLVRATPLLIQLIYIYYALPFVGIRFSPFVSAVLGLTLNVSAYLAEVYRSGIEAVPRGQHDAAAALGMRPSVAMVRVILPQAIRIVIPALGNYMVSLFKDTSLAAVITVQEMLFAGQIVSAETYDYFTIYTMVFILYFAVGYPAIRLVILLEKRVKAGYSGRKKLIVTPTGGVETVELIK
ncbi:amino acid ABC transporter permease [Nakamurella lactea]|uniref:amino acid ABC transporter permease n=1 Tax=Nakamurella lactea TaxID=459515 RepID=UPI0005659280|nr:amino acid ABC transporter permease [Nakamurella lactea]